MSDERMTADDLRYWSGEELFGVIDWREEREPVDLPVARVCDRRMGNRTYLAAVAVAACLAVGIGAYAYDQSTDRVGRDRREMEERDRAHNENQRAQRREEYRRATESTAASVEMLTPEGDVRMVPADEVSSRKRLGWIVRRP